MHKPIVFAVLLLLFIVAPVTAQTPPATTSEVGDNPLTGLPVIEPDVLTRRPIIVKISNAPPLVRPQAGLNRADHVWEHYAEGGLTRFSAVFYGDAPDRVGSVRSARLIDYELMPMYQGILAFSGASTGVETLLNVSDVADRLYKGVLFGLPYFWRDDIIEVPHNMFMNPNALWDLAAEDGISAPLELRTEIATLIFGDYGGDTAAASRADIAYRATRVTWVYEVQIARYRRISDGIGHFDANTLDPVTAANVVVLFARHRETDIIESGSGINASRSIEIELWFEGDAMLLRDGVMIAARWARPTRESNMIFTDATGNPLPFKRGNTWFQVMPLREEFDPAEESFTVTL